LVMLNCISTRTNNGFVRLTHAMAAIPSSKISGSYSAYV
jgi:hypothetical protein